MAQKNGSTIRNLVLVLGDQLCRDSEAFVGFDRSRDRLLMMELAEEASYVPQHKQRLVLFFSAMRHFRDSLREADFPILYSELDDPDNRGAFEAELKRWLGELRPERVILVQPGDHRVAMAIKRAAEAGGCALELRTDRHFLCALDDFAAHAEGRKELVMETFYRAMRRQTGILMDGGRPLGGQWNYDRDNRETFGKSGPGEIKAPRAFRQDDTTKEVLRLVERRFPDSPGRLDGFDYPVTADQAKAALRDFVQHRLAGFGRYQDAMATGRPYLFHSRLSCVLNLHLLDPRDAIAAAVQAYKAEEAPLNAVEGFVRQILGWREYVRGIYWREMPGYAEMNALDADLPMPAFMWSGETEMNCIRQSVGQLVAHAYAHHIQRLMVLGLFALLLGVHPYEVHRWHMSMYADAIDWVSLPNVLGMSQYGDGGIVGSKPYAASGAYIDRMSDYCADCRFDPGKATGDDACPFTTLYWDFLSRHRNRLRGNRRMAFQLKNLDRKDDAERRAIRRRAKALQTELTRETYL